MMEQEGGARTGRPRQRGLKKGRGAFEKGMGVVVERSRDHQN